MGEHYNNFKQLIIAEIMETFSCNLTEIVKNNLKIIFFFNTFLFRISIKFFQN